MKPVIIKINDTFYINPKKIILNKDELVIYDRYDDRDWYRKDAILNVGERDVKSVVTAIRNWANGY